MATDLRGLSLRNRINLRKYSDMKDKATPTLECHGYIDEFRDLGKTVDNLEVITYRTNQRSRNIRQHCSGPMSFRQFQFYSGKQKLKPNLKSGSELKRYKKITIYKGK